MCQIQGVELSKIEVSSMLADKRYGDVIDSVQTVADAKAVYTAVIQRVVNVFMNGGSEEELDCLSLVKNYSVAVIHGDSPAASRFKAMAKERVTHAS